MSRLTRRQFMKTTVVVASGIALGGGVMGCGDDDDDDIRMIEGSSLFPQSVMSGDPKESSVILWTRLEEMDATGDVTLSVDVATDMAMTDRVVEGVSVTAEAAHDHCVKVKVAGLNPGQVYYYRFAYDKGMERHLSNVGRTRTAPAAGDDVPVKYVFLSCQDYIGRYYNTLAWLMETDPNREIDFVVYLGDYIYETTGDPTFQSPDLERKIEFSDTAGAIPLGSGDSAYFGAASVSNYRELYKTYRSDPMLLRMQELYPVIGIWDDHEYTDDCFGDTATYFNGLNKAVDENNTARRQNAERVWYEYMPVDTTSMETTGGFTTGPDRIFGGANSTGIYRDLRFGKRLHMVLTDYRSFRPDHLIPEDAFPGTMVLDRSALIALFDAQTGGQGEATYEATKASFGPYLNVDQAPWDAYKPALVGTLTQAYIADGLNPADAGAKATADIAGNISAFVFNLLVEQYNAATGDALPLVDDETYNNVLDRGVGYLHMGKTLNFTEFGARYGAVKATYDLYAAWRIARTAGQNGLDLSDPTQQATATILAENVFDHAVTQATGQTPQMDWIRNILATSDATYLCVASSVSTISLLWDLTQQTVLPPDFQNIFYANVDHWDGFGNMRSVLIEMLKQRGNAFFIAGDIHSSFVAEHKDEGDTNAVADFTGTSVTSTTFNGFLRQALPALTATFTPEQQAVARDLLIDNLDTTFMAGFPKMKFANTTTNGFVVVTVESNAVLADFHLIDENEVANNYYDNVAALADKFTRRRFVYNGGSVSSVDVV